MGALFFKKPLYLLAMGFVLTPFRRFSPNGDMNNDYWHIDNIELYPDGLVEVFNRWGIGCIQPRNTSTLGMALGMVPLTINCCHRLRITM